MNPGARAPAEPVRPPTLREVIRARRAEAQARVEALRARFVEPALARFPRILPTAPDSAARYAIVSSIAWFLVGLLLALLLAVKLVFPEFLSQFSWTSYGRLAAAESAVMTWGVLFMGFVGAMFAIVPRVTGTKLWSERIGAQAVILLDQVVAAGVVLLLIGRTQGIENGELVWPLDLLLLNVMLMVAQNVFTTVMRRRERRLAVPLWHFLAALLILPFTYAFANLASPWYFGVNQQIVAGFGTAGVSGALTLLGVGTAYYVLPKATGLPIYSERLALMGFWSLVFAAPWVGQVASVFGPTQDELETVAIVFAVSLVIPAFCVITNLWGTMRGAWERIAGEPAVRFTIAGVLFLLLATLQFGVGSLRTLRNLVSHTTWDAGQQTALVGGLGLFLVALVYHQYPRIIGRKLFSARLVSWHFWATTAGLATVVLATAIAGLIQGYLQIAGVQTDQAIATGGRWFVITLAVRPLLILRMAGGALVAIGLILFVVNLFRTSASGAEGEVEPVPVSEPVAVGASA